MSNELTTTPENPLALLGQMDLANTDPDKMGKLLDLQAQWEEREAKKAFNQALVSFQADMPPVHKGRDGARGHYQFAAYEDIMRIARPILQSHGLSVSFAQAEEDGRVTVTCTVSHVAGHSRETPFTLPAESANKLQSGAQAQGSANSYARRYCLCNALDIVVSDEDDDGASVGVQTITDDQATVLADLLGQVDDLTAQDSMLAWAGVKAIEDIPANKFNGAVKALKAKLP